MEQPGLHQRHRDRNGEISRKHGDTLVRTLRGVYGPGFAGGFDANARLEDVLSELDEGSLSQLVRDHEQGALPDKIATANQSYGA